MKSKNIKMGVTIPANYKIEIEKIIETGNYLNNSHFIREAIREKLEKEKNNLNKSLINC